MKIFDCFMYSNEKDLLDLRLKYLDKYVDYFVIIESCFNHKGEKRKLLFNHKKYKRFKNKIIYLIYKKPKNLKRINKNASQIQKALIASNNAWLRENGQRNFIESGLNNAGPNDIILISDVDEIPNLENINFNKITDKLIFFRQKWFYYKLNLKLPNYTEIGTRACKKKDLISPQWLRNIKKKKYPFYRIDTFFSKVKYTNIKMIKDGGWHFTYLKKAKDIYLKLKSFAHHVEFELSPLSIKDIQNFINKKKAINAFKDNSSNIDINRQFYTFDKGAQLIKSNINELPNYVIKNPSKFKKWMS